MVTQRLGAIGDDVAPAREIESAENSVAGEAHPRKGIAKECGRFIFAIRHSVDRLGEIEIFEAEVALAPQTNVLYQGILVSGVEDDDFDRSPW